MAARFAEARVRRVALPCAGIVRAGRADARLAHARHRHPRVHALPHVAAADVELWQSASALAPTVAAPDGATSWTHVVGVDAERASDRALFRVLEWGGMEVK